MKQIEDRPGRFKKGNPGKPKGATNLITRTVKEGVLAQFCSMQDDPNNEAYKNRLEKFAAKYPREFYAMAARLIPTEIHAKINKVELHVIRTGGNLPENFAPASTDDSGHGEAVQYG